ncbi:hypothetical protein [Alkaliphilus serpentinus]|uniref:Uncharacterized protein n=1 Tax=Alkaliphilus serpentinus TaxID=1482731 RepID=A0A833HKZ7_9FIRM|nr:hypothetical protein [Alkaliphilus serpentinus]KAB3524433.1 hypothetical protein F8153_15900 [Alkaliphilus serpentinus]
MENMIEHNPAKFLNYPKNTKNVREGLSVIGIEVCRETCNEDRERAVFEFFLARVRLTPLRYTLNYHKHQSKRVPKVL